MRILGAAPRVPSPREPIPTPLRLVASPRNHLASLSSSSSASARPVPVHDESTSCFNIWRTRNADDDDERIALGDWAPSPSSPSSQTSSSYTSNADPSSNTDFDHSLSQNHSHLHQATSHLTDRYAFRRSKLSTSTHSSVPSSPSVTSPRPMEPWLTAILLVDFDQDSGPVLQACLPSDALTQAEMDTVCHHAMPDSATLSPVSICQDVFFSFRVPRRINKDDEQKGSVSVASTRLLLAHALFRQAPDKSKARGALQKALVLISSTPTVGLPALLLNILAPKAFVYGRPVLEHAMHDIDAWPDPRRTPSPLQPAADVTRDRQRKRDCTTTLLPFVDDLISIEWSDAFLTSFAAPTARLYTPEGFTDNPSSCTTTSITTTATATTPITNNNNNNNSSKRSTNINFTINSLFSSSIPSIASPTSVSPASVCFEQRHEVERYHDQLEDDHAVWDVSRRCKHAGAARPTYIRSWVLTKPSLRRGASLFHEINPVLALNGVLEHLQALWEIMIVGEPLLIVGSNPTACSAAVMALLSLIHPLPFVGEWRPYFCIQDPDYERIMSARTVSDLFPDGCIMGVSNRRMADMMKFPHALYLPPGNGQCFQAGITGGNGSVATTAATNTIRGRLASPLRPSIQRSRTIRQMATRAIFAHLRGDQQGSVDAIRAFRLCIYERITRPFLSVFERYVTPTSSLQPSSISSSSKGFSNHFNSHHHHHHFLRHSGKKQDVTEPYALDPFDRPLILTPFITSGFPSAEVLNVPRVSKLFRHGASSAWKARVHTMYRRFIQGPVFREWWHDALMVADRQCLILHRKHLLDACSRGTAVICHAMHTRAHQSEYTELVTDLVTRIQRELVQLGEQCHEGGLQDDGDGVLQEALKREVIYLMQELPHHKKVLFQPSCSRATQTVNE